MEYRQIEAFRAVMLTRSMTNAAAQLHTTQPNVSRLIARLQKELGLNLFRRVGLRLVPTPEAETLFREVQRSFIGIAAIRDVATSIKEQGSGRIVVGASVGLSISVLPAALQLFRQQRRDVAVSIHTNDSRTVARWASDGFCDFGIVAHADEGLGRKIELLHREPGVCIVPAGHRFAKLKKVGIDDFDGESFISYSENTFERATIDAVFVPDRRRLTHETQFSPTIWTLVSMGLGVSVVSPVLQRSLSMPGVRLVPFLPAIEFSCYAVRAEHRVHQSMVEELMDCIRKVMVQRHSDSDRRINVVDTTTRC